MRTASSENYSTRCMISHRPPFMTGEPRFYRCSECGGLTVINSTGSDNSGEFSGPVCCGRPCLPLVPCTERELVDSHAMKFTIFGGYDRNAVRIEVDGGFHPMDHEHRIEWIYLRTFQGGQLKLLPERSRSCATFSFADYDAFVYCDREVCKMGREHCQFLCKRGMSVYAYCNRHGLFRLEFA